MDKDNAMCILPDIGQENNTAQPNADKCPSSTSNFSQFNCRFVAGYRGLTIIVVISIVLYLTDKG